VTVICHFDEPLLSGEEKSLPLFDKRFLGFARNDKDLSSRPERRNLYRCLKMRSLHFGRDDKKLSSRAELSGVERSIMLLAIRSVAKDDIYFYIKLHLALNT